MSDLPQVAIVQGHATDWPLPGECRCGCGEEHCAPERDLQDLASKWEKASGGCEHVEGCKRFPCHLCVLAEAAMDLRHTLDRLDAPAAVSYALHQAGCELRDTDVWPSARRCTCGGTFAK